MIRYSPIRWLNTGITHRVAVHGEGAARIAQPILPARKPANAPAAMDPAAVRQSVQRISDAAPALAPAGRNQLDRALDRYQKLIAKHGDEHPAFARASSQALEKLVQTLGAERGPTALLTPATNALISLFDMDLRFAASGRMALGPQGPTGQVPSALDAVLRLTEALSGRSGGSSAVNAYPILVEQLALSRHGMNAKGRAELLEAASDSLAEATPKTQISQEHVSRLLERVAVLQRQGDADPLGILAQAKAETFAEQAGHVRAALKRIAAAKRHAQSGAAAFEPIAAALKKLLAGHPAGPASLASRAATLAESASATPAQPNQIALAAQWIRNAAKSAHVDELLDVAAQNPGPFLSLQAAASEAIDLGRAPTVMLPAAQRGLQLEHHPGAIDALAKLKALEPDAANPVELALAPLIENADFHGMPAAVDFLAQQLRQAEPPSLATLGSDAARFSAALRNLRNPQGQQQIAEAIAVATRGRDLDDAALGALAQKVENVQQWRPDTRVHEHVAGDGVNPGLADLFAPRKEFLHDPEQLLQQLIRADRAQRPESLRHALRVAHELGRLDRDPNAAGLTQRIRNDWAQASARPQQLRSATGQAYDDAYAWLDAHPELPPELAFTAGTSLSADQLSWLTQTIAGAKSQQKVRLLRDVTLAAIEGGRIDLLDALRQSRSGPKALSNAMQFIAVEYRQDRLHQIPFDPLIEGLRQGGDPAAQIAKARQDQALAELGIRNDENGAAGGQDELQEAAAEVAGLTQFYQRDDFHKNTVMPALQDAIDSVRAGTWPRPKYEGEIAERQLRDLSDEQKALWQERSIFAEGDEIPQGIQRAKPAQPAAKDDAPQVDYGAIEDKLAILRKALPDRAPLDGGPNLPELAYDAQSARLLRQLEQRLIGQLHGVEKGSDTHLDLRAQIGPVKDRLALIELEQALEDVSLAKMSRDELKALSDKMHAARVAAHRMGAHKVRNAITTMARALPDGKPAAARAPGAAAPANDRRALPGLVVADEDHLHALIGSHASGCMAAVGGFNCAALAAYLRDAQYKLTRVYQDGKPVARSTWRIYRATLPGYEGPVLWVDRPNPFSHQVAVPAAAYELHAKAALSKAKRLGIPLVFSTQYGLQAQLPGIQQLQGSLHIDMGHTGLHQTEQTGTYMVGWKKWLGHNGYVHGGVPDDQTSTALNIPMNVVMPN